MRAQGPTSEFRLNVDLQAASGGSGLRLPSAPGDGLRHGGSVSVGTDRDFLWGFMLGFFVGFLMLIWIWLPTVPHKQKLGILTGYSFHLALGMLKGSNHSNSDYVDPPLVALD